SEDENRQLGDLVTAELSNTRGLVMVERQELNRVLNEAAMSLSGIVRAADAVRVGKLLKVDWFLLGSTTRIGGTNFIVARIVDAKSGVMQDLTLLPNERGSQASAKALADFARHVRENAAYPVMREFLAVGQFGNVGVNTRQENFATQLRAYLMG